MKQTNSQSIILSGAIIIVLIFAAASFFSLSQMEMVKSELEKVNKLYNTKKALLLEMATIARERELGVFSLYILNDSWAKDEEYMRYFVHGARFVQLRDEYKALGLSAYEQQKLAGVLALIRDLEPKEEGIVEFLRDDGSVDIAQYLEEINIPAQSKIQALLDELGAYAQAQLDKAQARAEEAFKQARIGAIADSVVAVILVGLLVAYVYRRISLYERRLYEDKAMAEATVNSVTDGIIVTDRHGIVVDVNPVAQMFLHQSRAALMGELISEVFQLYELDDKSVVPYQNIAAHAHGPFCLVGRDAYIFRKGESLLVECIISPVMSQDGRQTSVCYFIKEVTGERKQADKINWRATHDPLTGVYNRHALEEQLKSAIVSARDENLEHALLYVDLDNFKPINDNHGHAAGDEMLKGICRAMEGSIRHSDMLARMGGDEFAILLYDCPPAKADEIGDEVLKQVNSFVLWHNGIRILSGGASIGVAYITHADLAKVQGPAQAVVRIFEKADRACYQAKNSGKNNIIAL